MRNDASSVRAERLGIIKRHIVKEFPKPVDAHKISLWIQINMGLTNARALEYLNLLCEANDWIMNDGAITPG